MYVCEIPGADIVGLEALLKALEESKKKSPVDVVICVPELMAALSAQGKALGEAAAAASSLHASAATHLKPFVSLCSRYATCVSPSLHATS